MSVMKNFSPDNQQYKLLKKNFSEKLLWIMKKVVLLHPLSEGTRGRREARRKRSSLKA